MIANITYGSNVYGVLYYNESKVKQGEGRVLFEKNIPGNSFHSRCKELENYCNKGKHLKYNTTHISLSFHPEDLNKINDSTYLNIVEDYLNEMGYGEQPYVAYEHFDRKHPHLHLVLPKITKEGKTITGTSDRFKSRSISRILEQKYQIKNAEKVIAKAETEQIEFEALNSLEAKSFISSKVNYVKKDCHYKDLKDFRYLLNKHNVDLEYHKGTANGNEFEGITYYLYDKKTKQRLTKGIKGSRISAGIGKFKNVSYSFDYHKKQISYKKKYTKSKIISVLNKYERITLNDLANELKEKNIQLELIYSNKNIPIGIRLYDEKAKFTANLSDIDRNLSWKNLQSKLSPNFSLSKRENFILDRAINTYAFSITKDLGYRSQALNYIRNNPEAAVESMLNKNKKGFESLSLSHEQLCLCLYQKMKNNYKEELQNETKEKEELSKKMVKLKAFSSHIKEEYIESLYRNYDFFETQEDLLMHRIHTEISMENVVKFANPEESKDMCLTYIDKILIDKLMNVEEKLLPFLLNYEKVHNFFKEDNEYVKDLFCTNEKRYINETLLLLENKDVPEKELVSMLYKHGIEFHIQDEKLYIKFHSSKYLHALDEFEPVLPSLATSFSNQINDQIQMQTTSFNAKITFLRNLEVQAYHYANSNDINGYLRTSNYLLQQIDKNTLLGPNKTTKSDNSNELKSTLKLLNKAISQVNLPQKWKTRLESSWKKYYKNNWNNKLKKPNHVRKPN